MTVAELIEHLKTLSQENLVVYRACSDMRVLDVREITVTRGVKHHNLNDVVRDYSENEWQVDRLVWVCPKCRKWTNYEAFCPYCKMVKLVSQEKIPEFVDVVMFPGN